MKIEDIEKLKDACQKAKFTADNIPTEYDIRYFHILVYNYSEELIEIADYALSAANDQYLKDLFV